jgi:hypothetical protein
VWARAWLDRQNGLWYLPVPRTELAVGAKIPRESQPELLLMSRLTVSIVGPAVGLFPKPGVYISTNRP